jgi:hypothetical protein
MARTKAARRTVTPPEHQNGNGNGHAPKSGVTDLSELFARKTAVVTIYDPRDDGKAERRDTGYRFEIAPRWSPEAQKAVDDFRDQLRRLESGEVDRADPKLEEALREQIVAVTKRFWQEPDSPDGIILEGELLTPSPENARKLYTHPDLWWLYEDVVSAYVERDRFFGAGPKTA